MYNLETTLITTLIILGVVLVISLAAHNYIEYVLMFTGGVCGVFILMIFPAYLVATSRRKTGYVEGGFTHQSLLKHWVVPYLFIGFGFASLIFNLFETISRFVKK